MDREKKQKQEKRQEKKNERLLRRHRWLWLHCLPIVGFFLRLHYGPFDFPLVTPPEGAYIVLPNHSCGADQFFVALSFRKKHMYFVASEHAFRKKLLGAVMRFATGPISRTKGAVAASAVLSILRRLRQGVPVCIFPEGNRTWNGRSLPIHPTTAKLLRSAGVPVLTYRIEGGYLTDPRWSHSLRRGRLRGGVVNVYRGPDRPGPVDRHGREPGEGPGALPGEKAGRGAGGGPVPLPEVRRRRDPPGEGRRLCVLLRTQGQV